MHHLYLILHTITVIMPSVCHAEDMLCQNSSSYHQIKPVLLSVLQHIHSRLAPHAPFHLLGYSFGGLLALELALQLEAEGREGKLYLVDSAPDFAKAILTQTVGSDYDEVQTSFVSTLFTLIAPHEATSAAVSKV
jgi:thioesterase domain-containing protein